MKKFPAVLLCGLAAMVLTTVLYFTILGSAFLAAIHFVALVGILLAEGITTAYACAAGGSPRRVAAAVVSGFMVLFSIVLAVVYLVKFAVNYAAFGQLMSPEGVAYFTVGYGSYIGWYCAGTIVVNVIAFILMRVDSGKQQENSQLQTAKANMVLLRKLVMSILVDPAAKRYEKQLRAMEEKLHFSNDAVIAAEDETIRQLLLQLRENIAEPGFDCEQQLAKIEKAIDQRNIMYR